MPMIQESNLEKVVLDQKTFCSEKEKLKYQQKIDTIYELRDYWEERPLLRLPASAILYAYYKITKKI
jgi:hypothetical protein